MTGWLLALLAWTASVLGLGFKAPRKRETCVASVFGRAGDRHMGTQTACKPYVFDPSVPGIAHRSLPCGSRVLLHLPRTGKWQIAEVVDRGPYGALLDDGTWAVKLRKDDPGIWRGCVDLTPPLSEALAHDGWDTVEVWK